MLYFVLSNDNFKLKGRSYSGFPILVDDHGVILEHVHDYLIYELIQRGRVQSKASWESYGRVLYDYFAFLEANELIWNDFYVGENRLILAFYRDWSIDEIGVIANTVNYRLRLIIKFYHHALKRKWIDQLPFEIEDVKVNQPKQFLAHTDATGGVRKSPDVMAKTVPTEIKLLTKEQIKEFLCAIKNPTQKLIARLALATGLRKEELATFPMGYVFNPVNHKTSTLVPVQLDPTSMKTKGAKPRTIHVPVRLMADLWDYIIHERATLQSYSETRLSVLFLNQHGEPYASSGRSLNPLWKRLPIDFKVSPHMLRHTYATHTLYALNKKPQLGIDPLMYVRDRLGHSSITTTQKYLHFIDQCEDELMTDFQEYLDDLSQE